MFCRFETWGLNFENLCGEPLYNFTDILNENWPRFSDCFQNTILVWLPASLFFISLIILTVKYWNQRLQRQPFPWNWLITLRIIGFVMIGLVSLIALIHLLLSNDKPCIYVADISSWLFWIVASALFIALELMFKRKTIRTSGLIFVTWVLFVFCYLPKLSTSLSKLHQEHDVVQSIAVIVQYVLILYELFLSCFSNVPGEYLDEKVCPRKRASFLNNLAYGWFWKMAVLGWRRSVVRDDLWKLDRSYQADHLVQIWDHHWKASSKKLRERNTDPVRYSQLKRVDGVDQTNAAENDAHVRDPKFENVYTSIDTDGKCPSIPWTLFLCFKWALLSSTVLNFIQVVLQFVGPQILKLLLAYLQTDQPLWYGLFLCFVMFISSCLQSLLMQQAMNNMFVFGMRLKTVLTVAVYKKALRLSNAAKKNSTVGEIVNHMAVDIQRFIDVSPWIQMVWSTPLQAVLSLIFLYQILGWSSLVGFAVAIIMVPLNCILWRKQKKYQIKQMKWKDDRIKLMSEILNGIKVIKLYAWEPPFEDKVARIRGNELKVLRQAGVITAWNFFTMYCSPFLIAVASFAAFTLSDANNVLTPQIAFVSMSLFNILRQPMNFLPAITSMLVQASVSNTRLRRFLSLSEMDEENVQRAIRQDVKTDSINMDGGHFTWDKNSQTFELTDINLKIKPGELVAVIGQVGEGKSSLISAILGEMEKIRGSVKINGSLAYVPQQAWIRNTTLRQNVTFTKPFDDKFYHKVIESCALVHDLGLLPDGDQTEIGEKGVNLSGGQKQRVSLARAVYQNKDIYLMDDPLSAVDAHVGKHIFDQIISNKNGLLRNKTRILVTHSLTFLKDTDRIVVIKDGKISESGNFKELISKNGSFADYLATYLNEARSDSATDEEIQSLFEDPQIAPLAEAIKLRRLSSTGSPRKPSSKSIGSEAESLKGDPFSGVSSKQVTKYGTEKFVPRDDKVAVGKVLWAVYTYYLKSVGYFVCCGVLFCYVLSTGFGVGGNLWLADWSSAGNQSTTSSKGTKVVSLHAMQFMLDTRAADNKVTHAIFVYYERAGGFIFLATILTCNATVSASTALHKAVLHRLMRSPMSFFDVTPLGAIINRVGKDVDIIDNTVPDSMRQSMLAFLSVLSSLVVILISTPIAALVILPMGVFYYFIQKFYINTARQLKRLESASRSPIFSFFGETVLGVSSIRAYQAQEWFIDECLRRVDYNQMSYYPTLVATRWLAIYLQFIGNCLVLGAMLFAVLFRSNDALTAGLVGLSITYSMTITQSLMMAVRTASDLETNIVAVERVKEYTELQSERPWVTDVRPPPGWPSNGRIAFVKFSLRYSPNADLVLRNINCTIESLEKVGIVGRTGAGKSSLSLALFRLIEPIEGGKIYIDNVDACQIGLHDLRSKLAIIPQEPILFSGSFRMNLDPFESHKDDELWLCLEQCYLKDFVSNLPDKLEYPVSEGGENLSVGQRQLICLARALLRKSKILIFDEATAAVDLETEALIQQTVNKAFANCTMLTIAHRLNTIMNSDRIIVLDRGQISEFDKPQRLLENDKSAFFQMARDAKLV